MALKQADRANFGTLMKAFENGDIALMEARDRETGEYRAVICAVEGVGDDIEFIPLAAMTWDNPYDLWEPVIDA